MTNGHDQLSVPIRHKYAILHAPICGIPLGKKYIREKLLKWNQAEFCLVFRVLCVCESILEHAAISHVCRHMQKCTIDTN